MLGAYDLLLLMDVIEHIDERFGVLLRYHFNISSQTGLS